MYFLEEKPVLKVSKRPVFTDLADAQRSAAEYFDYRNHEQLRSSIYYWSRMSLTNSPFHVVP